MRKLYTLIFVREGTKILLGRKTRGLGIGLWNGFGGKVEPQETVTRAAHRELKEESNLEAQLKHIGVVTYLLQRNGGEEGVVHVFEGTQHNGEVRESEEMAPIRWFEQEGMPYEGMWPDASSWVPFVLEGRRFSVDVVYGADDTIKGIYKEVYLDEATFKMNVKLD